MPNSQIFVIDTSDLIGALLGEGSGTRRGLQKTCHLLQIETRLMHNAGNDAHVSKSNQSFLLSRLIAHLVHSYGSPSYGRRRSYWYPTREEMAQPNYIWRESWAQTLGGKQRLFRWGRSDTTDATQCSCRDAHSSMIRHRWLSHQSNIYIWHDSSVWKFKARLWYIFGH